MPEEEIPKIIISSRVSDSNWIWKEFMKFTQEKMTIPKGVTITDEIVNSEDIDWEKVIKRISKKESNG
jgi:hypothetical protein